MAWNREREAGSAACPHGTRDAPAVGVDDGANDRQPQSAAATVARTGIIAAYEGLEDMGRNIVRYSRPVVFHAKGEFLAIASGFYAERSRLGIAARIFKQGDHDLPHAGHIAFDLA